ncbi:MAG TPA: Pvc16 family protein [Allosphingosinicella sp.]|nr:Pvc16 family protein [Allosphingosinicella sp.]
MATYLAIAAAGAALRGLIRERYPRGDFDTLTVEVYQAKDVEKGLTDEGFGIVLWRVAVNAQLRARGPRTDPFGRRFKASLPLDLSFIVVPVAASAEKQLRMLGWLLREIEDSGTVTAAQFNEYLGEDSIFSAAEDAEIVLDPLSVADQLTMWDRIRKHPLIAHFQMRTVLIDSAQAIDEYGPVVERAFEAGPMELSQ